MPVDRAALGLVAEQRHARRVQPRARRLGPAGGDEQVLLLIADVVVEELAADVTADEVVEVGRRRDDPAGRPRPASGRLVADVLRGVRRVQVVAVEERLGHLDAGRQRRVVQSQRIEHLLGQHVGVGAPGGRLDHQSRRRCCRSSSRRTGCRAGTRGAGRRRRSAAPSAAAPRRARRATARLNDSTRMKSGTPLVWLSSWRSVTSPQAAGRSGNRWAIVSSSDSTPSSTSDRRGGPTERLGHAGDPHVVVNRRLDVGADLDHAGRVQRAVRRTLHHDDDRRRAAGHRLQLVNRLIQRLVELRRRRPGRVSCTPPPRPAAAPTATTQASWRPPSWPTS